MMLSEPGEEGVCQHRSRWRLVCPLSRLPLPLWPDGQLAGVFAPGSKGLGRGASKGLSGSRMLLFPRTLAGGQ